MIEGEKKYQIYGFSFYWIEGEGDGTSNATGMQIMFKKNINMFAAFQCQVMFPQQAGCNHPHDDNKQGDCKQNKTNHYLSSSSNNC